MRLFTLAVCIFNAFSYAENWKIKTDGDAKTWSWTQESKQIPIFANAISDILIKNPSLKASPNKNFYIAHFSRRSINKAEYINGAVVILEPGKTATNFLSINLDTPSAKASLITPGQVEPHEDGFFLTTIIGSQYYILSYILSKNKLITLNVQEVEKIRENLVTVELSSKSVTIQSAQQKICLDKEARPVETSKNFAELTGDNIALLKNTYKAIDLTEEAASAKMPLPKFAEPFSIALVRIFNQSSQRSPILVESNYGVESHLAVELLARQINDKKILIQGQDSWKIFEVSWKTLNTEGIVNLTLDKVNKLFDIVRQKRAILYFPDIDQLQGLGIDRNQNQNVNDATSAMQRDIQNGTVIVLGRTTSKGLLRLQQLAKPFADSFTPIKVEQPKKEELLEYLRDYASTLGANKQINFSDAVLNRTIDLSNQFILVSDSAQPRKSKAAIEAICSNPTRFSPNTQGTIEVTENMVLTYLADKTGIGTLASASDKEGIRYFLKKENFFKEMDKRVIGHKAAKEAVWKQLNLILDTSPQQLDATGQEMGVHTLMLFGPSGTGKSFFPDALADSLKQYKVQWDPVKFEMSKWSHDSFSTTVTGAPPSYIGFKAEGGAFIEKLRSNPQTILVFEEFDKSNKKAINAMYDLLDFGKFQDANLNEVSINRSLVFITSNYGAQGRSTTEIEDTSDIIDQYDAWHYAKVEPKNKQVKKWNEEDLKNYLLQELYKSGKVSPQIIGRIGQSNVIILHHFSKEEVAQLATVFENKISGNIQKSSQGRIEKIIFSEEAHNYIVEESWGPRGETSFALGARAVKNYVEQKVYPEIVTLKDNSTQKGSIYVTLIEKDGKKKLSYEIK